MSVTKLAPRRRASTAQDPKAATLAADKLIDSGLTLEDAEILGIECLSPAQVQALDPAFKALRSLKFNYFDPSGQPMSDWPTGAPFYRLRYLEKSSDFNPNTKKLPRYMQPHNTAPAAYYPRNCDWREVIKDVSVPLIMTEGELKAAKACKEGFPTIGLGGVHSWRAHRLGITWLPSLALINWQRRHVYVCFDSDYRGNKHVCVALIKLSEELQAHGAYVYLVTLPNIEDFDKVGIDDFLTHAGAGAPQLFRQLLADAEPLGLAQPLWTLNAKYAYVKNPGLIIDQTTGFKTTPAAFRDHLQSAATYYERHLKADGTVAYRLSSAAIAWLKWGLRTEVERLSYRPGKVRFAEMDEGTTFNIWPGWGCEPKKGDVKPFLDLIDHLFTGADRGAKQWFLRWCAHPLQYPGTKLFSSVLFHGIRHGTGKSLVGYTLGQIYGENFTEIDQHDLHNQFNEWAECKQFVMGDDITGSNKREDNDRLKKIITQRKIRINSKHIRTYEVEDCINYFFTANHPDAYFLEDDDRRHFIHEVNVGPLPEEFYVEYGLWLDSGGAAAVFQYLLDLDLDDFNPVAPALRTAARERMIANVQSDLASWVRTLVATPDAVLRVGEITLDKDLFTSRELLELYDPLSRTGTTANGVGRELARAGVRQVANGVPVRLSNGTQARYYAIRQPAMWLEQPMSRIVSHLEGWNERTQTKKVAKY